MESLLKRKRWLSTQWTSRCELDMGYRMLTASAQSPAALLKFLGGMMIPGPTSPGIPGADFAGVVHSAGKDSKWAVGDEVYGIKAFAPLADGEWLLDLRKLTI